MRQRWVLCAAAILFVVATACSKKSDEAHEKKLHAAALHRAGLVLADDIPVVHTPPGGLLAFPPLALARCTEPLAKGAPDLRGMWLSVSVTVKGAPAPKNHPLYARFQRIEQCGDRIVIAGEQIIHDMRADGTEEHGIIDVAATDRKTPIHGVATFEDGAHVIRPAGVLGATLSRMTVTRRLDHAELVMSYMNELVARWKRMGGPEVPPTPGSGSTTKP